MALLIRREPQSFISNQATSTALRSNGRGNSRSFSGSSVRITIQYPGVPGITTEQWTAPGETFRFSVSSRGRAPRKGLEKTTETSTETHVAARQMHIGKPASTKLRHR